jgi:hypothetical protein
MFTKTTCYQEWASSDRYADDLRSSENTHEEATDNEKFRRRAPNLHSGV